MSTLQSSVDHKENVSFEEVLPLTLEEATMMDEIRGHRVTLQTLQPLAKSKGLVGSHGQIIHPTKDTKLVKKPQATIGKIQIFEDESSKIKPKKTTLKMEEKEVQTEESGFNDLKSITTDEVGVEYYITLAERRREALAEALEENEQLHKEVNTLRSEIEALKTENGMLKPLAEEAEYLAGVLKDLVGSEDASEAQTADPVISSDS